MVAGDAVGVSGRQGGKVGIFVSRQMQRTSQGRLQKTLLAEARRAAVFGQVFFVQRQYDSLIHPVDRRHFANSRNTLRRFFMIRRARVICWANCGS